MSNGIKFNRTRLDQMVEELSAEDRYQMMLDFDGLERTGVTGDSMLRQQAMRIYQAIEGRECGMNALYLSMVGLSCHKITSIQALEAAQSLDPAPGL